LQFRKMAPWQVMRRVFPASCLLLSQQEAELQKATRILKNRNFDNVKVCGKVLSQVHWCLVVGNKLLSWV
jgi:hypothetical protein